MIPCEDIYPIEMSMNESNGIPVSMEAAVVHKEYNVFQIYAVEPLELVEFIYSSFIISIP
jgi:hypothetical protein